MVPALWEPPVKLDGWFQSDCSDCSLTSHLSLFYGHMTMLILVVTRGKNQVKIRGYIHNKLSKEKTENEGFGYKTQLFTIKPVSNGLHI